MRESDKREREEEGASERNNEREEEKVVITEKHSYLMYGTQDGKKDPASALEEELLLSSLFLQGKD